MSGQGTSVAVQEELERQLLAYAMSDRRYTAIVVAGINPKQLRTQVAQRVLMLVIGYFNRYNGVITDRVITDQMQRRGLSVDELVLMRNFVAEVRREKVVDEAELEYIITQLLDAHRRRLILGIAEDIANVGPNKCTADDLEKLQGRITRQLVDAQTTGADETRSGEVGDDALDRLEAYEHRKSHPEEMELIRTGWNQFDAANGGVRPGELAYVIGRKGDGKSVFMLQFGYSAWLQGKNVILYSLEISKEDYQRRFDACAARVNVGGLKMGKLSEEEEAKYRSYIANLRLGKSPSGKDVGKFHIVDITSPTPALIQQLTEQTEKKQGVVYDVVIVDYSQLMRSNTQYDQLRHELASIALDLKNYAREQKKFVLTGAQMNRIGASEASKGATTTAAIAEADAVADHADYIFSVFSTSDLEGKLEMPKIRDGAPVHVNYVKNFAIMRMEEAQTGWEDA